jgi:hypothetical protein
MNLEFSVEEASQRKMYNNQEGYQNRMVSQRKKSYYHVRLLKWDRVEWYHGKLRSRMV